MERMREGMLWKVPIAEGGIHLENVLLSFVYGFGFADARRGREPQDLWEGHRNLLLLHQLLVLDLLLQVAEHDQAVDVALLRVVALVDHSHGEVCEGSRKTAVTGWSQTRGSSLEMLQSVALDNSSLVAEGQMHRFSSNGSETSVEKLHIIASTGRTGDMKIGCFLSKHIQCFSQCSTI